MLRFTPALLSALATAAIGAVVNLLTNLVSPDLIRPWWWVLTICLAVLVYLSVYGIQRGIGAVQQIAACSPGDGSLHLFAVTKNGKLASREFREGRSWSSWKREPLPQIKARDVTAMAATRDLLELYVADNEGVVWQRRLDRDGRSWSAWENLDTSGELGPLVAIAAYSGSPTWREVYAVGSNTKVAHRWREDGHPWHAWSVTGRDDAQDIALTSAVRGMLECFIVSRGGEVWHRWYVNNAWSEWGSLGRPENRSAIKAVAAMSGQEKHQELFVLDTRGNLAHRWHWQGSAWSDWAEFPAPEPDGAPVCSITAAASSPGCLHVIAVVETGNLWQRTYTKASNWSEWKRVG